MTFEELLKDPNVLYVYETGPQIYGLFEGVDRRKFTVICKDGHIPDIKSTREKEYSVFPMKIWFDMVMSGNMLAWICACLNKKFIHKEAVKLLLTTNPLQLRKEYDRLKVNVMRDAPVNIAEGNFLTLQKQIWELYKYLKFANQIIENHKIVNFKCVAAKYNELVTGEEMTYEQFSTLLDNNDELKVFKGYTDEILKQDKIKRALQNANL